MRTSAIRTILCLLGLGVLLPTAARSGGPCRIELRPAGSYASGIFAAGGAEIVAFDGGTRRAFVVNARAARVDILDVSDPADPVHVGFIDVTPYGAVVNSVAVHHGLVAVAIESAPKTDPGRLAFFDASGGFLSVVSVGAQPDMVTFTPDGRFALTANEGEPNDAYTVDPEGSVSIVDLSHGAAGLGPASVRTAGFGRFNGQPLPFSVRVYGPGSTAAQDFEPEYIAVSADSRTAFVTLQENNAVAVIDIGRAHVDRLLGLGFKNHALPGNELDASDKDGGIHLSRWPVWGMYLPDSIAAYRSNGETYLVLANEGDSRAYSGFDEEARIADLTLDPVAFPNAAALQAPAALGRLKVTTTLGDVDGDGDFDRLFSFGARSFSIRTSGGQLVFDSASLLERITAAALPNDFNSTDDANGSFDSRSDDKGPEPEGVAVGRVGDRSYAFIGLERVGGIAAFDVTDPRHVSFVQYVNTRDFAGDPEAGTAGDLSPEGLAFVRAQDSPTGVPLLLAAYEVSGTVRVFEIVSR